jgi:DNA-nicking Smr family endonuclease
MTQKSKKPDKRASDGHSDKKDLPADADLWDKVKKTVTPIKISKKPLAASTTDKKKPADKPTPSPTPRRPAVAPSAAPAVKNTAPGLLERSATRRITRGDDVIEARLDLHGMTQAQAHTRLVSFIQRAQAKGLRTLLVITGKGRLSEGGGVLKRQLPLWLESGDLAGAVLSFAPAHIKDGGGGAFYLRLRKIKK